MEVPVINRISEIEAGFTCLQNPSLFSQFLSLPMIETMSDPHNLWKLGAVILALFATFTSLINTLKLLIPRLKNCKYLASQNLILKEFDEDFFSESDDESSSTSSTDDDDFNELPKSPSEDNFGGYEDYNLKGLSYYSEDQWQNRKLRLRRRRSFGDGLLSRSDFGVGKSVVKLWDGLGLGLKLESNESSSNSVVSVWDVNEEKNVRSFPAGEKSRIPAAVMAAPAVVLTAGMENGKNAAIKVWDSRVASQIPVISAEWEPRRKNIVGINSGGTSKKVYVKNEDAWEVRDMRVVNSPLEADGDDTWWDADAVMVEDDGTDDDVTESAANGFESVVSRCRNAVKSCLLKNSPALNVLENLPSKHTFFSP